VASRDNAGLLLPDVRGNAVQQVLRCGQAQPLGGRQTTERQDNSVDPALSGIPHEPLTRAGCGYLDRAAVAIK
jgi:hypothetical protein